MTYWVALVTLVFLSACGVAPAEDSGTGPKITITLDCTPSENPACECFVVRDPEKPLALPGIVCLERPPECEETTC